MFKDLYRVTVSTHQPLKEQIRQVNHALLRACPGEKDRVFLRDICRNRDEIILKYRLVIGRG